MKCFSGLDYLKIDIANNMGLDKWSWDDRIHWTNANIDILEDQTDIADNKPLYRKAVHALRHSDHPLGHIMFLDATASGIQIMAALSGCEKTGQLVNLVNTGERQDIYDNVATEMTNLLGKRMERKRVKKPIMTHYYNKQSHEDVFSKEEEAAFYKTLDGLCPGAEEVKDLINKRWNKHALNHRFTLPDGHVAYIPVTEMVDVVVTSPKHKIEMPFRYEANVPSTRSSSLLPNVIHAIDGYIAREMVRMAHQQGFELLPIHDAFGSHPNYMNLVRRNYRTILSRIANSNILANILSELSGELVRLDRTDNIGNDILDSEYALS